MNAEREDVLDRAAAARTSGLILFAASLTALVGVGASIRSENWAWAVGFTAVALLTAWACGSEWREARECREHAEWISHDHA